MWYREHEKNGWMSDAPLRLADGLDMGYSRVTQKALIWTTDWAIDSDRDGEGGQVYRGKHMGVLFWRCQIRVLDRLPNAIVKLIVQYMNLEFPSNTRGAFWCVGILDHWELCGI